MNARAALLLVLLSSMTGVAHAGLLRVEQDGSGDYLLIQEAVDAAADGDTILIGPGRYDDLQPRGYNDVVCVARWDDTRALAFIGENADDVIIGPTNYAPAGYGPQGIHQHEPTDLRIEGISFENLRAGLVAGRGTLHVAGARFDTGELGVFVQDPDSCFVSDCTFSDMSGNSVAVFRAGYAEIVGCEMSDAEIYFGGTANAVVRDCKVTSGVFMVCYQTSGLVADCDARCDGNEACMYISDCDSLRIYDSVILGGATNVSITGQNINVIAERNEFLSPTSIYANIEIGSEASLDMRDCHFRAGESSPYIVRAVYYFEGNTAVIDLGGNYWFEHSTPAQLDSLIFDGNDDPNVHVIVNYDPIRTEPVPAKKPSFGGLKAMYR